jgi:hypothetical protein
MAYGRVDITRGSTVLRSFTISPDGKNTHSVSLPRQATGSHTIYARYRGSSRHQPSHTHVRLVVR